MFYEMIQVKDMSEKQLTNADLTSMLVTEYDLAECYDLSEKEHKQKPIRAKAIKIMVIAQVGGRIFKDEGNAYQTPDGKVLMDAQEWERVAT